MENFLLNVIGKIRITAVNEMLEFLDTMCTSDFEKLTSIVLNGVEARIYHNDKTILIKEAE